VTIHDSVMTTPPHVETVVRVIQEEFARIGVNVQFRVEDCGPVEAEAVVEPPQGEPQADLGCPQSVVGAVSTEAVPEPTADERLLAIVERLKAEIYGTSKPECVNDNDF